MVVRRAVAQDIEGSHAACSASGCEPPRDHGGDLDKAIAEYGGSAEDWIDLSTGINRQPYPVPELTAEAWTRLPAAEDVRRLCGAAQRAYRSDAPIVPLAGAQAAIQLVPRMARAGRAAVLGPTYNEHAAALRASGWQVIEVATLDDLKGADLAVVVNPNNPDGRVHQPDDLSRLSENVGRLVVDESFVDATPELSLAPQAEETGVLVLRSFGKFYGLAGLRLGFVLGPSDDIARLRELAGPWAVSGAAIEIGSAALGDARWAAATMRRLKEDAERLDALAATAGWSRIGGTALFRLYSAADAAAVRAQLARHHIWSRAFPWSAHYLRLGLPGNELEWERLEAAMPKRVA